MSKDNATTVKRTLLGSYKFPEEGGEFRLVMVEDPIRGNRIICEKKDVDALGDTVWAPAFNMSQKQDIRVSDTHAPVLFELIKSMAVTKTKEQLS